MKAITVAMSVLAAYRAESGSSSVTRHRHSCLSQNAVYDG
jgi:hypothetical protein